MRALAMPLALSLMMAPALAASPQVEAAIKAFQTVDSDANRMKTFCELMRIDEQNEKRTSPSLEAKMDELLNELGADFEAAWELVEDTDPASEDGKVLSAALDRAADKCPD
jgi:predicted HAD superfamily Cof-like phosphohydrolase